MKTVIHHPWKLSLEDACELQKGLAQQVSIAPYTRTPRLIAGIDAAFSSDKSTCIAGVVLWDVVTQQVLEEHVATHEVYFPYIPGYLSFREVPAVLKALELLTRQPDLLMCDGHGVAHPRSLGIASHIGVIMDQVTIGCAKSRLVGHYEMPGPNKGDFSPLVYRDHLVAYVLRTKVNVKPVFVGAGHKIDHEGALRIVQQCVVRHKLPEPTRLADRLVAKWKKGLMGPF